VRSSHDDYLAQATVTHRRALEQLRKAVLSVVPDAEQVIRTGVPAFRYHSRPLVSIGDAHRHVALYVMYGDVLKTHAQELTPYDVSNTVVRFDPTKPIPVGLVSKLVRARVAELDRTG
jgi:uncharacterized protein YdhG (YjbR/CyaY superfamily)